MKKTLSVIVITKNEEDRIYRCLNSIKHIADEIIVFDSGSTDKTVDIAKQFTTQVYVTDWQGYGVQKQRALEKARGEWVLSLDADEEVDATLGAAIVSLLETQPTLYAYRVKWKNFLLGKPTRFGRTGRSPTRLFQREFARFDDAIVHEKVYHPGKAGIIKSGYLNHYSVRDFEHLMYKNRVYAGLMASKKHQAGKKSYGVPAAIARSLFTFLQIYIFRLGFLDGSRGLLYAVMFAQYSFNKYTGLWALEQKSAKRTKDPMCFLL